MNILIIGSEGFIGSNLNRNFQAKGNSITALDIIEKEKKEGRKLRIA